MKKIIIGLLVIIVIIGLILVFRSVINQSGAPSPSGTAQLTTQSPGDVINASGWILCLPHKTTGSDCAIGIREGNGSTYALVDATGQPVGPDTYTTGQSTVVSGVLVDNKDLASKYVISGVIQVR